MRPKDRFGLATPVLEKAGEMWCYKLSEIIIFREHKNLEKARKLNVKKLLRNVISHTIN